MTVRVVVVEFAGRGGMIQYAFQLCRGLAQNGAEVTLVTDETYELDGLRHPFRLHRLLRLWDPKPPGDSPRRAGGARRLARAVRYYRSWLRLGRYLRRERPDLVLFGDIRFAGDLCCLLWLRRAGLTLADVCHNLHTFSVAGGGFASSPRVVAAYRRIYCQFSRVFVHYQSNRRRFLATYGGPPERVIAIPHGNEAVFFELRDPRCTAEDLRRRLGLGTDDQIVLLFGSLSRYKGADLLLEAFALLAAEFDGARLVLAGFPLPDFDLQAIERRAVDLGLSHKLRVSAAYIESREVSAWMELASVAVFPYRTIYQSGALQLAQTFGVPTVATGVGATAEAVGGGDSALLVPPGDVEALAAAIGRVLGDRELACRLGRQAAIRARRVGDWEAIARTILDHTGGLRPGAGVAAAAGGPSG